MTQTSEISPSTRPRLRILLGQLNSNGDCLYATTVARQIKHDFPACHLTWAIGSICRKMIDQNPHVDHVWEIPLRSVADAANVWHAFERDALVRQQAGEFDKIFFTQIFPRNVDLYDGGIRSSLFRGYPGPITVPVSPVLQLRESEVANVAAFATQHCLKDRNHVILFESSAKSGQSFITADVALELANRITREFPSACILLSSDARLTEASDEIIDASVLSIRENAELTKYCTLLLGCSSGITWIATSEWAKPLPTIQLIEPAATWVNSLVRDHTRWGLPTDHIIEMTRCPVNRIIDCVRVVLQDGFAAAKPVFHEQIELPLHPFVNVTDILFEQGRTARAVRFLARSAISHPRLMWGKYLGKNLSLLAKYGWQTSKATLANCGGRTLKHLLVKLFSHRQP